MRDNERMRARQLGENARRLAQVAALRFGALGLAASQ